MKAGPVTVMTLRGKVHRARTTATGKVVGHPRCNIPTDAVVLGESWAAFDTELLQHPWVYCRYGWCFRDVLREMGIDPRTGHIGRQTSWRPSWFAQVAR